MKNENCINCKYFFMHIDVDYCFFKCTKSGKRINNIVDRIDNIEGKCEDFERKVKNHEENPDSIQKSF